jgi:hypothetical protein
MERKTERNNIREKRKMTERRYDRMKKQQTKGRRGKNC